MTPRCASKIFFIRTDENSNKIATCTDLPSKIAPSQGWCTGSTPVRAAKATRFRISGNRKSVQIRFYYGRISTKAPESAQNATCVNLDQQGINKTKGEKMKKLLLIALVAIGSLFVPVQRSDAQITVGVGGVGIGFGYPGYRYGYYPSGYGYYPYGYYRPYPYHSYYSGPSYYWSNGHRYYRHHHHHHYYRY